MASPEAPRITITPLKGIINYKYKNARTFYKDWEEWSEAEVGRESGLFSCQIELAGG